MATDLERYLIARIKAGEIVWGAQAALLKHDPELEPVYQSLVRKHYQPEPYDLKLNRVACPGCDWPSCTCAEPADRRCRKVLVRGELRDLSEFDQPERESKTKD